MATSNTVDVVVVVANNNGYPQPIGARRLARNIEYSMLVSTLHQVTGIDNERYTLKISATLWEDNRLYLIPINNDDDLWFFLAPDAENRNVHVLVDKKELQSIPVIPQSNVGGSSGVKRTREDVHETEMSSGSEVHHETWPSSVKKLPKLMGAIKKWNPGTIVEWKHMISLTNGDNMLKYMFWAFKACIDGFRHSRRIVCVDATHLFTKYRHNILTAVSVDANQQILPLAFALVDEENCESWSWFLDMLSKHVVRGVVGMCLITSMNDGLLQAVKNKSDFQPPRGVHRLCLRRVCSDLNSKVKNIQLKDLCWKAGSAFEVSAFEKLMGQIKALNEDAHNYLAQIDKGQWTIAHDGRWRYGVLTTNLPEYMTGVLKDARHLPICTFVRVTFDRCSKYFHDRLEMASVMQQRNQPWPDATFRMHDQLKRESVQHQVYMSNPTEQTALVKTFMPQTMTWNCYLVKLNCRDCTCGYWNQIDIPCSHAMLACRYFGVNPAIFMNSFYNMSTYIETYSGKFTPLPNETCWDEASFELCHIPALQEDIPASEGSGSGVNVEMNLGGGQQYQAPE